MAPALRVTDLGRVLEFGFEDLLRHHGGGSPGGVAHAFKVMELALPLLGEGLPPERSEIRIETAFGGPGARDAFECVTCAVGAGRYRVDAALARPDLGFASERFVFRLSNAGRDVTLAVRAGWVSDGFVRLARTDPRTPAEEDRLTRMKAEMAERVMAAPAEAVYALDR